MKIFVLGYKGMLGRYVYDYFYKDYEVIGIARDILDASKATNEVLRHTIFRNLVKEGDVLINCMGVIRPHGMDGAERASTIMVNSIFPNLLADICEEKGCKLIHVSTDCVFSGADGNYTEKSPHDPVDVYGMTKSLGEPSNCTVIRTSIVGEEVGTSKSLIEWVKSQEGKTINGYTNHHWNGVSCHQLAKVFEDIIKYNKFWKGVRHIYSPRSVTKYELVQMIIKTHSLNIEVTPFETETKCDRTLSTVYMGMNHSDTFNIPDIMSQLEEQKDNPPYVE